MVIVVREGKPQCLVENAHYDLGEVIQNDHGQQLRGSGNFTKNETEQDGTLEKGVLMSVFVTYQFC